jgi:hypothetical protein
MRDVHFPAARHLKILSSFREKLWKSTFQYRGAYIAKTQTMHACMEAAIVHVYS